MSPRIYVESLSIPATDRPFCVLYIRYGTGKSSCVIKSKISDRPFGDNFLEMGSGEEPGKVILALYGTDWKGRDSICSPCRAPRYGEVVEPLSRARPPEAQAYLSPLNCGTVGSLNVLILISQHKAMNGRILEQPLSSPECELEQLMCSCLGLTRHETVLKLVRGNRRRSWTCRRMPGVFIIFGRAPQGRTIQNKPGADFLLLRKERKEELYASHSYRYRSGGEPYVCWKPNDCS